LRYGNVTEACLLRRRVPEWLDVVGALRDRGRGRIFVVHARLDARIAVRTGKAAQRAIAEEHLFARGSYRRGSYFAWAGRLMIAAALLVLRPISFD